jgi:hypothetical protein
MLVLLLWDVAGAFKCVFGAGSVLLYSLVVWFVVGDVDGGFVSDHFVG